MLGKELSAAFNKARIGSTCEVLFERERPDGTHRGHTKNYLSVDLKEKHPFTMRGKTAAVLITDADENTLYGDLI
jgi:tRNA A37 methylthiotransferase MiaB